MSKQIFPVWTIVSVNKSFIVYTYTNKIAYDEFSRVRALPGPYAGPYTYVRTASQPVKSKNSFRISISVCAILSYIP